MNLTPTEASEKCWVLGVVSALMIVIGYPDELLIDENDLGTRWKYWALAMCPFLYIVYTLLVGLADATMRESDPAISEKIRLAQIVTVVSWLTYPVVYVFPMLGFSGAQAVVAIQCGYCASDIISKCGVGLIIYSIPLPSPRSRRKDPCCHSEAGSELEKDHFWPLGLFFRRR